MDNVLSHVPEVDKISFSEEEEKIFAFWKEIDAFQQCLKQSKNKPRFTFFDGPPFATGLPHYGHILAGTIKDIVTRWAHQTGHHVERRFGWDTHGLPVEYEIDKANNINGPEDVEAMGIKKYNELCRAIVSRYSKEWEEIISRLGRWIDFKNDYKTMYPTFMESVWWVFSQLYDKGFVYKGVKVMPFSTACSTPLSNFEAGQNYKDTQDPSVVVNFPLEEDPNIMLVAWTTTPWTLPSNMALCVNPDADYVKVKGKAKECEGVFILMEARLTQIFKSESDYEVLERFKGRTLEGKSYVPLFDYFIKLKAKGAFKVLMDGYVSSESGTGVVHQAPYFGEDDFRISLSYGIITKDQEPVCPVDDVGRFTDPVSHFKGRYVKEADNDIIKHIRANGRLVQTERINHSYPYCWRSDTPLIYRAVPSWFIRVEQMQDKLLESNEKTYWVPSFVKDKRQVCKLAKRCQRLGNKSQSILGNSHPHMGIGRHGRDSIDHITIPSNRPGKPPLKRISEVFDCWFESGSMPYAQVHYPFENKREFEDCFPADFIAEGIDQTRGWFYTLLVLSTALFGKAPFRNLICNGLILAADGQKMSKSKKNYPDPMGVVRKYGADVIRLYLINSPAVRGENLRFREEDVFALLKEVFIPWLNAYRFFVQQVKRFEKDEKDTFEYDESSMGKSHNVMDRWILSFTQSLLAFVHQEMSAFKLYTVTPRLIKFVDNLTNWYVRFNRKRLKGEAGKEDCLRSLETLYSVLLCMIRVMSPFTPFITETMFQNLRKVLKPGTLGQKETQSVHYLMVPSPKESLICPDIETSVSTLQSVVELGRYLRDKVNNPLKYPLPEVVVIHKDQKVLDDVLLLESYIKEELNVRKITTSTDKVKYGVALKADINFKNLGARLKGDVKKVKDIVSSLSDSDIQETLDRGYIEAVGHRIDATDIFVKYKFEGEKASELSSKYEAHSDNSVLILLDITPSQEMIDEGQARVIANRLQKLRKKAQLIPTDEVTVWYEVKPSNGNLSRVANSFREFIENTTKTPFKPVCKKPDISELIQEQSEVGDETLTLVITKDAGSPTRVAAVSQEKQSGIESPVCPWVNIVCGKSPRNGLSSQKATLLLQNPFGSKSLSTTCDVLSEIHSLFGVTTSDSSLYVEGKIIDNKVDLQTLARKSVYFGRNSESPVTCDKEDSPYTRYVNLEYKDQKATLLLENPVGSPLNPNSFNEVVKILFNTEKSLQVFEDKERKNKLQLNVVFSPHDFHGKRLYLL
ncbi:Isoleucine--tRNA ligase, cytoplasmic [Armadillidium nasatum]|uniref:isoleucine--tRNA ligase n=1 Tax=Armadillidium nasatum TaxID=96803 RepID=A0A5N5TIS0_9CRUS|nr:Isoleucine--tRNA ligase, cytoplasmic [Armadillidium nasatum]